MKVTPGGRVGAIGEVLLAELDEAFDRKAWHGPNLLGAVRGLDAASAARRPAPGRHSIWEIVLHCAYWKHRVRPRLIEVPRTRFPHPGVDWPRLEVPATESQWRSDLALLRETHRALREAIASLSDEALARPRPGLRVPRIRAVAGMALHDTYHAGQIRLLRRLAEGSGE